MKRPTERQLADLAVLSRQFPEVVAWLSSWAAQELTQLPHVPNNTAVAQGRCQVLMEITDLLAKSPDMVAKS